MISGPKKFTSKVEGKMGYEDFVYFILAEEDKSSEPSLEYWYIRNPDTVNPYRHCCVMNLEVFEQHVQFCNSYFDKVEMKL